MYVTVAPWARNDSIVAQALTYFLHSSLDCGVSHMFTITVKEATVHPDYACGSLRDLLINQIIYIFCCQLKCSQLKCDSPIFSQSKAEKSSISKRNFGIFS